MFDVFEDKSNPLNLTPKERFVSFLKDECAWWDVDYGGCAVKALPYMLDQVAIGTQGKCNCK